MTVVDLVPCPRCDGLGVIVVSAGHVWDGLVIDAMERRTCHTCGGRQAISRSRASRIRIGMDAEEDRVSRGLTVREEAARLGMPPQALRRLEAGFIDA